jgi:hypothetical protein
MAVTMLGAGAAPLAMAGDRHDRRDYRDDRYAYQNSYHNAPSYSRYDYRDYRGHDRYEYRDRHSGGESAAIIGGGAAAGAVIGGLTGGGKGAAIGALVGGVGGLVVDQATKDHGGYRSGYRR